MTDAGSSTILMVVLKHHALNHIYCELTMCQAVHKFQHPSPWVLVLGTWVCCSQWPGLQMWAGVKEQGFWNYIGLIHILALFHMLCSFEQLPNISRSSYSFLFCEIDLVITSCRGNMVVIQ